LYSVFEDQFQKAPNGWV